MKTGKFFVLIVGLLGVLGLSPPVIALEKYTLEFIQTQNAPPGAQGTMTIDVVNGGTNVHFSVKGAYPNTVYTIWIVYNILDETKWPQVMAEGKIEVPSISASTRPGFPPEGNGVSPLAGLGEGFTAGMGPDPGASFVTNNNGDGEVQVKLDYNLINGESDGAPVSNKDLIAQCVPGPLATSKFSDVNSFAAFLSGKINALKNGEIPLVDFKISKTENGDTTITFVECPTAPNSSKRIRVTTTWLRRFIGQFPLGERDSKCANYDPVADPNNLLYDAVASKGMDARLWQCIDPASDLPRVHRFQFDHFRLANHPDDLTHGFIGGNGVDHWIDMVGRKSHLVPTKGISSSSANSQPSVGGKK